MISCTIDKFKILEEILEQNHIKLLSKKITTLNKKYIFQFQNGKTFEMTIKNILQTGVPRQMGMYLREKNYLGILREIAEKNGGKLLSTQWEGQKKKYQFESNN